MEELRITAQYIGQTHEINVEFAGYSFLIIFGKHINGWFIAIPNWGISCEAAHPRDVFYNTERLNIAFMGTAMELTDARPLAETIAEYHSECMESLEKRKVIKGD